MISQEKLQLTNRLESYTCKLSETAPVLPPEYLEINPDWGGS